MDLSSTLASAMSDVLTPDVSNATQQVTAQAESANQAYFNQLESSDNNQQLRILANDNELAVNERLNQSIPWAIANLPLPQVNLPDDEPAPAVPTPAPASQVPSNPSLSRVDPYSPFGIMMQQLADSQHEREYGLTTPDDGLPGQPQPEWRPIDSAAQARLQEQQNILGAIAGGPIIGGTYFLSRGLGFDDTSSAGFAEGMAGFTAAPIIFPATGAITPESAGATFLTPAEFAELPSTGTINPNTIRFSQDSVAANFRPPYGSVDDLAAGLADGSIDPSTVDPIRLVEYNDGGIYTIDNRRLYAFQQAGLDIPYQKLDSIPSGELFKFTTPNQGVSVTVREGGQR
jgi:hypothetical protein